MIKHLRIVCGSVLVGLGIGGFLTQAMAAGTAPGAGQAAAAPGGWEGGVAQMPAGMTEALKLPKGDERKKALSAAAADWAGKDPTAALDWAITADRDDRGAAGAVFSTGATQHGKETADWMVKKNTRASLANFHGVMYAWARTDAKAAAAWSMDAPENVRYVAFFSVGDGWYTKDSKAASEWAVSLKTDADRWAAIHGVALKWARANVPAATVWIKTLKGNDLLTAAKAVVQDSHANRLSTGKAAPKDQPAVLKWLDDLGLSDAQKQQVLNAAPLPPSTVKPMASKK